MKAGAQEWYEWKQVLKIAWLQLPTASAFLSKYSVCTLSSQLNHALSLYTYCSLAAAPSASMIEKP